MPKLGDEIYGKEISKSARTKYIWVICKICIMKDGPLRELSIKVYPDNVKVAILKMLKPFE